MSLNIKQMQEILVLAQFAGPTALQDLKDNQKEALEQIATAILNNKTHVAIKVNANEMKSFLKERAINPIIDFDHPKGMAPIPTIEIDDRLRKIESIAQLAIPSTQLEKKIDKAVETFQKGSIQRKRDKIDKLLQMCTYQNICITESGRELNRYRGLIKGSSLLKKQINKKNLEREINECISGINERLNSAIKSHYITGKNLKYIEEFKELLDKNDNIPNGLEETVAYVLACYDQNDAHEFLYYVRELNRYKNVESEPQNGKRIIKNIIEIEQNNLKQLRLLSEKLDNAKNILKDRIKDLNGGADSHF